MSDRYTKDVKEILDAFMRAVDTEESLSDDVLRRLQAMISEQRMGHKEDINALVGILTDEANAKHH